MTEAQAKRTQLKVWQDFLVDYGGTVRQGDTLYATVRKVVIAMGYTPPRNVPLLRLMKHCLDAAGTARYNDTRYQTERRIMLDNGVVMACCALPPIQNLAGRRGAWMFGDPGTNEVFAFGTESSNETMGNPINVSGATPTPPSSGTQIGNPAADVVIGNPDSDTVIGIP